MRHNTDVATGIVFLSTFKREDALKFVRSHFTLSTKPTAYVISENVARTSKKTQPVSTTKISWLMLLREIIAVYRGRERHPQTRFVGICGIVV